MVFVISFHPALVKGSLVGNLPIYKRDGRVKSSRIENRREKHRSVKNRRAKSRSVQNRNVKTRRVKNCRVKTRSAKDIEE